MWKYDVSVEKVEAFNDLLDALLNEEHLPAEGLDPVHADMVRIAEALAHAPISSLARSKALVEQSVPHATADSAGKLPLRKIASVALLISVLVFIVACATSPTFRAEAKKVLLRVGNLIFTNEVTEAQQALPFLQNPPATPQIHETSEPHRWDPISQDEASRIVGFQVLVPRDVPEQEWERAYRPAWGSPKEISWKIFESPAGGIYVQCHCFRFHDVFISQRRVEEDRLEEFAVAGAQVAEVDVRNTKGYYIEDAPTAITGGGGSAWDLTQDDVVWQVTEENFLIWEEGGILYIIRGSDELGLSDFLAVANALSP